ncbi:DUF559 domain-containing protein [Actinoplanes sp. NPDC023936]|uniref:DUF559 domain-containing protein n=1 Tax=Actinoplanes sp. NPDC023936 TaxID=3154910 RepID=UPI0033BFCC3F
MPAPLTVPFRGSAATAAGLLTKGQLRGPAWQRLLPDVYAHRDLPVDHGVRCAATALLLPPGTAIGGLSAAYLWGADLVRPRSPVSVVAPRNGWMIRDRRISAHYTTLADTDLTVTGGLPVTTVERTAFDLGRRLPRSEAVVVLDALLHRGLDPGDVSVLIRQRPRWPGIARLEEALRLADARAESPMETRLRLLFGDAGLPGARPQCEVRDERGKLVGRVDLGWPAARLAVEYEGDHHRDRDQFRRDLARVNALRLAGWTVLRFTADDVNRHPEKTAGIIAAELARLMP